MKKMSMTGSMIVLLIKIELAFIKKISLFFALKKMVNQTKEISIVADVVRKYHNVLPMSIGTGSTRNGAKKTLEVIEMTHFFDIVINDTQSIFLLR